MTKLCRNSRREGGDSPVLCYSIPELEREPKPWPRAVHGSGRPGLPVDRTKAGGVEGHAAGIGQASRRAEFCDDRARAPYEVLARYGSCPCVLAGIKPGPAFVRFTGKGDIEPQPFGRRGPGSVGWPRPVFGSGRALAGRMAVWVVWTAYRPSGGTLDAQGGIHD